jgi:lantibiotic leader peptide-processing serine protease
MNRRIRRILPAMAVAALAGAGLVAAQVPASAGADQNYIVLYNEGASSAGAASAVAKAGGSLVANYSQIGVVIARSGASDFATRIKSTKGVQGAAATTGFATRLADDQAGDSAAPNIPATDSDSLSGLQWDMRQIHTPEAHAITGGSPSITVGDIDTGLDYTHPDLAPNVDFAKSVSCLGGVADNSPSAWNDENGHGTHTAGTMAAASNGIGIVGVAPNVKVAGIRAGNADGFFFPEAVVCSFMWVATHGIAVTNNSYFADPWLFNCRNDAGQRAIWNAERRALRYAQSKGSLAVSAAGNEADDLTHPTQDATSPDDTSPVLRQIHNDCAVFPAEAPGVVTVSADGNTLLKSFYSSYGAGVVDVVAPGGDSILGVTAQAPNGRVLSTWPASLLTTTCLASRRVVDASGATYCYQQGTSMASPHVAGLAALIASQFPGISPGANAARIGSTADPMACPSDLSIYAFFPAVDNGAPQKCTGGIGNNSFYGAGQVNARTAIG